MLIDIRYTDEQFLFISFRNGGWANDGDHRGKDNTVEFKCTH